MHVQLVRKPVTVKICYHGLSAHKEQFAITTDGKMEAVPLHELKVSQTMLSLHTERSLFVLTFLEVTNDVF